MPNVRVRTAVVQHEDGRWGIMAELHSPSGIVEQFSGGEQYESEYHATKAAQKLGQELREKISKGGASVRDTPPDQLS